MDDRIGIGILSHAHGHSNIYCRVMQGFDDIELIATWDDNVERGQKAAQSFGMEYRPSADDIIRDPRIDAVIVTTETNRHAEFVERAAAAGKHILCQKPMATTVADCDRIIAAVEKHGVKFSMAFQMRHDPVNVKIRELVKEGAVGPVAVVRRRHAINVLLNPGFFRGPTRWHLDPVANIGMFFDDATHAADWFYWMLGEARSVTAEVDNVVTDLGTDDNGIAIYRFGRGEIGILLNSSTTVAAVSTTEIYGSEGTIIQDYGDGPATSVPRSRDAAPLRMIRKGEQSWTEFHLPIPKNQGERIAAVPRPFIDYVRGRTDTTISAREGRKSVEMVWGAYLSAAQGRRIDLPL
jgi:predicted dehydrogenase